MRSSISRRKTDRMRKEGDLEKLPTLRGPGKEDSPEKKIGEMVKVAGKQEESGIPKATRSKF